METRRSKRRNDKSDISAVTPAKKSRVRRSTNAIVNSTNVATPSKTGTGTSRVVTPIAESTLTPAAAAASSQSAIQGRLPQGTSSRREVAKASNTKQKSHPGVRRRISYGTVSPSNVRVAYGLIKKISGSLGGNGSFGAIYGELTMGSMQKIVDLLKLHTKFDSSSRFIDVGSGLGKPSIHVCQDPGVQFSYGIEMERSRYMLGMTNLKAVLNAVCEQQQSETMIQDDEKIGYRCFFNHGNIRCAASFDPFTHVYMFSIGFPPSLWRRLAKIFNSSSSGYMICYHSPKQIIDKYGFNVELVTQTQTSMHGSSEGHMGYIYKRKGDIATSEVRCDPLYAEAWGKVRRSGWEQLRSEVNSEIAKGHDSGRLTRSREVIHCIEPDRDESEDGNASNDDVDEQEEE